MAFFEPCQILFEFVNLAFFINFSLTVCMAVHKLGIHVNVLNVWTV